MNYNEKKEYNFKNRTISVGKALVEGIVFMAIMAALVIGFASL